LRLLRNRLNYNVYDHNIGGDLMKIDELIAQLKKVYPDRLISIEQQWIAYSSGKTDNEWSIYIEEVVCEKFENLDELFSYIKELTETGD